MRMRIPLYLVIACRVHKLIVDCFSEEHARVITQLAAHPQLQYCYLKELMNKEGK